MYMDKHTMEFIVSFGMTITQPLHLRLRESPEERQNNCKSQKTRTYAAI